MALRAVVASSVLLGLAASEVTAADCLTNSTAVALHKAFDLLDTIGDGVLSPTEVEGKTFLGVELSEMFVAADRDGDGSVVLAEFQSAACSLQHRAHVDLSVLSEEASTTAGADVQAESTTAAPSPRLRGAPVADRAAALHALEGALHFRAAAAHGAEVNNVPLGRSLEYKVVWKPLARCEKYIMLGCGKYYGSQCYEGRNAECNIDGDCVCPEMMCSNLNGVCVPCDVEEKGVDYCNVTYQDMWETLCNGRGHHLDDNCPDHLR